MKKRVQGLAAGIVIGAILTNGVAFAKKITENAWIYYNNIKVYIDGGEIVPKDANGNVVEPFTMNGTTYLPIRAVSNAFGKDVEWDGTTRSVYIGKKDRTKPDTYLDRIQYNDYKEGYENDDFTIINGKVTDYNGNIYTSGLLFYINYYFSTLKDDNDSCNSVLSYPLNGQYENLTGKIVIPKSYELNNWGKEDDCKNATADVYFYGDGKLLYKATYVTTSMPFNFDIDVEGVNQLSVKIKLNDSYSHIALTDLALYK